MKDMPSLLVSSLKTFPNEPGTFSKASQTTVPWILLVSLEESCHSMNPSHASHLFQVAVALAEGLEFRAKTLKIMLYMFGVSLGRQHLLINLTIKNK